MPISYRLSKRDSAEAALLEIERRRLSSMDMYVYAVSTMVRSLNLMRTELLEDGAPDCVAAAHATTLALQQILATDADDEYWFTRVSQRFHGSTVDTVLGAYGRARDLVWGIYNAHLGADHDPSCCICVAMCECAGIIWAVKHVCDQAMERAKTQAKAKRRAPNPHQTVPILTPDKGRDEWRITCVRCGVIATVPEKNVTTANELARTHERSARDGDTVKNTHP